tara:strand:- start:309 stop:494 length:186 start_codon:yes stop_codon:yes gene_type:complete
MQFTKNTSNSKSSSIVKILMKLAFIILIVFFVIVLIGKIDFPAPNKKIQKIIPNENFKKIQ